MKPAEFVIIRIQQKTREAVKHPKQEESDMATGDRDDPYAQFNFLVDIMAASAPASRRSVG